VNGNLLAKLIAKRDRLTAAIEVLQEETAPARHAKAARVIDLVGALQSSTNGHAPKRKYTRRQAERWPNGKVKYPSQTRSKRDPFRGAGREVAAVPVPAGVSFDGVSFPDAVAMAVRAVKQPIPTPELALLLESAGVAIPPEGKRMPPRRYVGLVASGLVRERRLKKTADGWARGARG
jgi:hypothetical protein